VLALELGRIHHEYPLLAADARSFRIVEESLASPALLGTLLGFMAALVLVYGTLGVVAWCSARLSALARGRHVSWQAILAWLAAWYVAILTWNALLTPNSIFARPVRQLALALGVGETALATASLAAVVGALGLSALFAARRRPAWPRPALRPRALRAAGVVLAATAVAVVLTAAHDPRHPAATHGKPNVIFIGVDSLRSDVTSVSGRSSLTPHIDQFLGGAHVFSDAVTPLARTFPSWLSLLTGRHPVTTGARVNLMAREKVHEGVTLPALLRRAGYRSVLATDEVRFSNIDESYGFDQLITPPIGAADFVLGTVADLPLPNLLANHRISAWLFPYAYANRAAYKTYDPATFVRRVASELEPGGPVFLAIHLTLPHWPYAWRELEYDSSPSLYRRQYPESVRRADAQFSAVLGVLADKGLLDNALVFVLSDHGEAVGAASDSLLSSKDGNVNRWWSSLWGHGTSVLNPHQYQVLLAARSYGNGLVVPGPRRHAEPASLLDVAPTVLDLLAFEHAPAMDGLSLAPLLDGSGDTPAAVVGRIRFTETELNPPGLRASKVDMMQLAADLRSLYEVSPGGRIQLTDSALAQIVASKELAAMRGDQLLAVVSGAGGRRELLWFDGRQPSPTALGADPDLTPYPDAQVLLEALRKRFPGEI
jgi:arylsulfatase A-like enzyme